jgi:predicted O-methyltransferase YrrM
MSQETWTAVDKYIGDMLVGSDAALEESVRQSEAAGLPSIQVSPPQGKLLHILALSIGAQRILEIGTLGGYSTIWMARALPDDGELITLEIDPKHADVAKANIERAGLAKIVRVEVGDAREILPSVAEKDGKFDLIFIDADKPSNPFYFEWALKMSHKGSLIIIDNVVRDGAVIDESSDDASVQGVRRINEILATEKRVSSTVIQTVGVKGYDGLAVAFVVTDQ